jgi:hypothetical protein
LSQPACSVCGAPARPPFRAPTAELAPDLDHRPGEPARSTLPQWIATCRRCGASGPDLARLPAGADVVVRSDEYRALRKPDPAMPFLRWALICRRTGDRVGAAEATLHAAWALDDADKDSAGLRRAAVELFGEPDGPEDTLRLVDMLRRAGEFARAADCAAALDAMALDENSAAILAFQRKRIIAADLGRHMISSALRPPARRPHVTHGRNQETGFWGRLFGR